ncbi:T9SS-dependent choice-of-anchor J family protein [Aestuariivivens sediminis]|uniref:T9SS-dependent choice-of-anchor J family protein n=1 Tax=Aestuariivivens sediminis TaxID=2913557 RepID=UPI001F56F47E|nr:choice-of-anchor J domain-containing protein [Aestuariivivens sediminis]
MKRLLLLICIISANYPLIAQCYDTLPVTETFDDSSVIGVCWNVSDKDGDGNNWYWREYGATYGGHKCLTSRSWNSVQGDLNPDNWIYSNSIDLTSFNSGDNIQVTWKVRGENATYSHEYYTVYASTGNQISDFQSSPVQRGEYADEVGGSGTFVTRSLDISSLAGNMIYLAFRHENISGSQFILNIDDVSVSSALLSTPEEISNLNSVRHYYDLANQKLVLKSDSEVFSEISLFNVLGKEVLNKKLNSTQEYIDLSNFNRGIYIAKVRNYKSYYTIKILKQ